VLEAYHALLWPDTFIVGGGVTENWEHFGSLLNSRAEVVRAAFGNDAGIVGAAMAASELRRA
jgi:polyphosphate glucokinase